MKYNVGKNGFITVTARNNWDSYLYHILGDVVRFVYPDDRAFDAVSHMHKLLGRMENENMIFECPVEVCFRTPVSVMETSNVSVMSDDLLRRFAEHNRGVLTDADIEAINIVIESTASVPSV